MLLLRRSLLSGLAAGSAMAVIRPALAQAWKAQFPELVFAVVPAENASGVTERYGPFVEYLNKQLGTKVTLRIANDYAAVIEGQRAGNIQIGYYGPASFARARVAGVKTEAFAIEVNNDGSKGYYSVFYVLAKTPFQTIADLKGKNLGLVDPNSTSGYNMPVFALDKQGITPDAYFGKTVNTGSHENAILALTHGTVDVVANWWNADDDSNLTRMLNKKMLKHADGTLMKREDFRIVLKTDMIINSPIAYLENLPEDLKLAIRTAFMDASKHDKAAFDKLSDGKSRPWQIAKTSDYDETIKLIQFVDRLRRKAA